MTYTLIIRESECVFRATYDDMNTAINQATTLFKMIGNEAQLWFLHSDTGFAVWDMDDMGEEPVWVPGDNQELIDMAYGVRE